MIRDTRQRWTIKEIAAHIGSSDKFVRAEMRRGEIAPVVRVNARVIWVRRSAVTAYCERRGLPSP